MFISALYSQIYQNMSLLGGRVKTVHISILYSSYNVFTSFLPDGR